jgi:2-polyprenyl-3-methyl-5-hydroxy-6-metoxy-1,4-benzoquinol methylase
LLAPGNLPELARELPTEFIFLTGRRDEPLIRESAGYQRLASTCKVSFCDITDLITEGNHSTTVTLAYTRAVRRTGEAMLDTCFFFLVSDYIVADGSLLAAMQPMLAGASGVQAGNFQIIAEEALPWLEKELTGNPETLSLPPRRLMQQALTCIHPATIANTVNLAISHNSHSNRLFWRVDQGTLIGRFFLLHMLCIRPELVDFVIGASCDYSFIPEMCPSGNVVTMTDSDQYLVVEAQPRYHEARFLRLGPADPRQMATILSQWTTAQHRANAGETLIFHAGELPSALNAAIREADEYMTRLAGLLGRKPMPHRDHPYWRGAIAAHQAQKGLRPADQDWDLMLGRGTGWASRLLGRLQLFLLGRAPEVRPWHPRWPDYELPRQELEQFLTNAGNSLLVVSSQPTPLTNWAADRSASVHRIPISRLARPDLTSANEYPRLFDGCYFELNETQLERVETIFDRIVPLLRPGAEMFLSIFNSNWDHRAAGFGDRLTTNLHRLLHRADVSLEELRPISRGAGYWSANAKLMRLGESVLAERSPLLLVKGLALVAYLIIVFGVNLAMRKPRNRSRGHYVVSSVFMRLRAEAAEDALTGAMKSLDAGDIKRAENLAASGTTTKEPQYERLLEVQREAGMTSLGLMTNQVWYEDPRRLTFILARYKFVSKMLSGFQTVAEMGCGDAFGTRVVQQEVESVIVYDFDPLFVADIKRRQSSKWPIEARVHDILDGPLPEHYDGIYSLDVIEHIPEDKEDLYLQNLVASLNDHGVLIIGSPSVESQTYASPQSKIGHINCKSGRAMKALLERYFNTVFLFSMNDEVVHTGYYPMAHYLFALCSDRRTQPL